VEKEAVMVVTKEVVIKMIHYIITLSALSYLILYIYLNVGIPIRHCGIVFDAVPIASQKEWAKCSLHPSHIYVPTTKEIVADKPPLYNWWKFHQ
jgi:hypothetical protein